MEPLINVVGLKKSYGSNSVLKNIEFKVYPKEKVVLIGPSGGGKSTLLRCLNRLEECEGEIEFEGKNIVSVSSKELQFLRRKMGMVFQQFDLFPNMTVLENITFAPVKLKVQSQRKPKAMHMSCYDRSGWTIRPMLTRSRFLAGSSSASQSQGRLR